MAGTLQLLALAVYLRTVASWTYTEYITTVTTEGFDLITSTNTITVSPTGPVSPTTSNITTTSTPIPFAGYLIITVTDLILGPNEPVCTPSVYEFTCRASTTTTNLTGTPSISTKIWAAVTVSNPLACTQTSFAYTTSSMIILQNYDYQTQFPGLFEQGDETGSNGEALFITTYIVTESVDLGGQAIISTICDIWLKATAMASLTPSDPAEVRYLSECVDPRRYLCGTIIHTAGDCGTDWVGTYPSIPGATTTRTGISTAGSVGGSTLISSTKASGAGGRDLPCGSFVLMTLTTVAFLCVLLY